MDGATGNAISRASGGRPSAAVLIVGDEILAATYPETNSARLLALLRERGVDCRRVVFLPDEVEEIAAELRAAVERYDLVFTSGGIGPTHDDCTMAAVARALDRELEPHPRLLEILHERYGPELNAGQLKVASVPRGCTLIDGGELRFPLLRCDDVFVLPGVPWMFEAKLAVLRGLLAGALPAFLRVAMAWPESQLTEALDAVVAAHPSVKVGSYPRASGGAPKVELTFEAATPAAAEAALAQLRACLPADAFAQP